MASAAVQNAQYRILAGGDERSDYSLDPEDAALPAPRRRWPSWRQISVLTMTQIVLLYIYTAILIKVFGLGASCGRGPQDVISSPASNLIQWEFAMLDTRVKQQNAYTGEPSDEVDHAWRDIINLSNSKVPIEAVRAINKTSIEIPDDPGMVWVTLGVNHELHCLNRLRQAVHADYYFSDWTDEERKRNQLHSRHCIDYLRQAAMCHGDLSLTTYYWGEDNAMPVADFNTAHACVNWEAIQKWEEERAFDPLVPGLLQHPKFGVAFPDGEGDKIGVLADHQH